MKMGLVFGKFMPLHKGHLALIDFALKNCDHLNIVLCCSPNESIVGAIRKQWLDEGFKNNKKVSVVRFDYDETLLPNTSVSSREVSYKWGAAFRSLIPETTIVFTSEPYGQYVAQYMGVEHIPFDPERKAVNISATLIRKYPFRYWDFLPTYVRTFFVKKVCIVGTESTGKTTLTERLAVHFKTAFVPEAAREIVAVTDTCTHEDLLKISIAHAEALLKKLPEANKLLFVDTDVNITASYSEFLFHKPLAIDQWVQDANSFDLYLFLEPDCDFVQDGTRLSLNERNRLSEHHKLHFVNHKIPFVSVGGNWENRFTVSHKIIETAFSPLS